MKCKDAYRLLNAWVDGELQDDAAKAVEIHISGCGKCAAEAEALRRVSGILDGLQPGLPPSGLQQRTMTRFERDAEPDKIGSPGVFTWWREAGWPSRTALVSGTLAGLWAGCLLGLSLISPDTSVHMDMVAALCISGGIALSWA
ncbi:MAG: zf-HC2 domain-containing protein [Desulfobacterales bacterium]|nr:zf-HC2 domain-containing protein [Desulfobacterales bacterium]